MITWEYIVWAFGVAGIAFGVMSFPQLIAPKPYRETVALWLTEREEDRWARQFGQWLDYLFGPEQWTLKRLWRSAITSFISVGLLYLAFGPVLNLLETRTEEAELPFVDLILFGLVINVGADYLSLGETRWLLRHFEHVRSALMQGLLLLVDLLATAVIILTTITLFRILSGAPLLMPEEIVAGYTVFSVFFYSTFLTSVWAWIYCASAWLIRLFSRTRLGDITDVYERPFVQISTVTAGIAFIGLIALQLISTHFFPKDLDGFVCNQFGGRSCTHAARLTQDEELKLFRISRACETGDYAQCRQAIAMLPAELSAQTAPYWARACSDGGDLSACTSLGFIYDWALGVPQDHGRAHALYEQACEGGNMPGCTNLGVLYWRALGVPLDYDRARTLFEKACNGDAMSACNNLGHLYQSASGVTPDYDRAVTLYARACAGGEMSACNNLGTMYHGASGVSQDYDRARTLYEQACDGDMMIACNNLGVLYWRALGVPLDYERARTLFEQACNGGEVNACFHLGHLYRDGLGVPQDSEKARSVYEQACDGGGEAACEALEELP